MTYCFTCAWSSRSLRYGSNQVGVSKGAFIRNKCNITLFNTVIILCHDIGIYLDSIQIPALVVFNYKKF